MIHILMAERLISMQEAIEFFELNTMTSMWMYPESAWTRNFYTTAIGDMISSDKSYGLDTAIVTDSELLFQAVRVLVKQGKISASDLQFMIRNADESIDCPIIDQDGRFDYWPDFWNYHGNCLRVLLDFPDLNK